MRGLIDGLLVGVGSATAGLAAESLAVGLACLALGAAACAVLVLRRTP